MKDDIFYMKEALLLANLAAEEGEVPVGAVVTLESGTCLYGGIFPSSGYFGRVGVLYLQLPSEG